MRPLVFTVLVMTGFDLIIAADDTVRFLIAILASMFFAITFGLNATDRQNIIRFFALVL